MNQDSTKSDGWATADGHFSTQKKATVKKSNGSFYIILTLIAVTLLGLKLFVYQQVTVVGESMLPSYEDGQLLMVNQLDKNHQRGQVVAVYADENVAKTADYFTRFSARFFLKRIIGLPGESIEIIDSNVIIYNKESPNGVVLNEPYITSEIKRTEKLRNYYYPKTEITKDHFFLMGDNRSNSTDSRNKTLGAVPEYSLFGIENFRFWPASDFDMFSSPAYTFSPFDETLKSRKEEILDPKNQGILSLEIR